MAAHRFIGDHQAATPLAVVRSRRAVLGTGEIPGALRAMAGVRTLYSETSSDVKPQIHIERVESAGQHLWRVSVPVGDGLRGALPGRTLERHPSIKFLEEVGERQIEINRVVHQGPLGAGTAQVATSLKIFFRSWLWLVNGAKRRPR
jgi:hypothetical protein